MKKILAIISVILFAGCAKTNEDLAKALITENLKTSLPNSNSYQSVSFGTLGTAFLPYQETEIYINGTKKIKYFNDSIDVMQQQIVSNTIASTNSNYKAKVQQLLDSTKANEAIIMNGKQGYTPEKLFKIAHTYKTKNAGGVETVNHEEFYLDKDVKHIVKQVRINK